VTVLRSRGLTRTAGPARIVDDVALDVVAGEIVALAGPNGAGKTTLLRLLAGELAPSAGSVELLGRPVGACAALERARLCALMPQSTSVAFPFTVRQVVEMGRHPWRRVPGPAGEDVHAVAGALADTGVEHLAERTFPSLSGGEQALVTLARVLAQRTQVLLLDEPTAALDIRHQQRVLGIARRAAGRGVAVVVVLHDLNHAAAYADRILLMDRGRVVADGTPRDVLSGARLSSVYCHPIVVTDHPAHRCPLVVPAAFGHDTAAAPTP
jgi:iron complex transport system ATP-binding protein